MLFHLMVRAFLSAPGGFGQSASGRVAAQRPARAGGDQQAQDGPEQQNPLL